MMRGQKWFLCFVLPFKIEDVRVGFFPVVMTWSRESNQGCKRKEVIVINHDFKILVGG